MPQGIATFFMFTGEAENAMRLYVSLFANSAVGAVTRFAAGEAGPEGSIKQAEFTVAGHRFRCFDSPIRHEFTFTPAISIFVDCSDESEFQTALDRLSSGGELLMPPDDYGFSRKFVWLKDRWGVSWQLNLP